MESVQRKSVSSPKLTRKASQVINANRKDGGNAGSGRETEDEKIVLEVKRLVIQARAETRKKDSKNDAIEAFRGAENAARSLRRGALKLLPNNLTSSKILVEHGEYHLQQEEFLEAKQCFMAAVETYEVLFRGVQDLGDFLNALKGVGMTATAKAKHSNSKISSEECLEGLSAFSRLLQKHSGAADLSAKSQTVLGTLFSYAQLAEMFGRFDIAVKAYTDNMELKVKGKIPVDNINKTIAKQKLLLAAAERNGETMSVWRQQDVALLEMSARRDVYSEAFKHHHNIMGYFFSQKTAILTRDSSAMAQPSFGSFVLASLVMSDSDAISDFHQAIDSGKAAIKARQLPEAESHFSQAIDLAAEIGDVVPYDEKRIAIGSLAYVYCIRAKDETTRGSREQRKLLSSAIPLYKQLIELSEGKLRTETDVAQISTHELSLASSLTQLATVAANIDRHDAALLLIQRSRALKIKNNAEIESEEKHISNISRAIHLLDEVVHERVNSQRIMHGSTVLVSGGQVSLQSAKMHIAEAETLLSAKKLIDAQTQLLLSIGILEKLEDSLAAKRLLIQAHKMIGSSFFSQAMKAGKGTSGLICGSELALSHFLCSLKAYEACGSCSEDPTVDSSFLASLLFQLGGAYVHLDRLGTGLRYFEKCYEVREKSQQKVDAISKNIEVMRAKVAATLDEAMTRSRSKVGHQRVSSFESAEGSSPNLRARMASSVNLFEDLSLSSFGDRSLLSPVGNLRKSESSSGNYTKEQPIEIRDKSPDKNQSPAKTEEKKSPKKKGPTITFAHLQAIRDISDRLFRENEVKRNEVSLGESVARKKLVVSAEQIERKWVMEYDSICFGEMMDELSAAKSRTRRRLLGEEEEVGRLTIEQDCDRARHEVNGSHPTYFRELSGKFSRYAALAVAQQYVDSISSEHRRELIVGHILVTENSERDRVQVAEAFHFNKLMSCSWTGEIEESQGRTSIELDYQLKSFFVMEDMGRESVSERCTHEYTFLAKSESVGNLFVAQRTEKSRIVKDEFNIFTGLLVTSLQECEALERLQSLERSELEEWSKLQNVNAIHVQYFDSLQSIHLSAQKMFSDLTQLFRSEQKTIGCVTELNVVEQSGRKDQEDAAALDFHHVIETVRRRMICICEEEESAKLICAVTTQQCVIQLSEMGSSERSQRSCVNFLFDVEYLRLQSLFNITLLQNLLDTYMKVTFLEFEEICYLLVQSELSRETLFLTTFWKTLEARHREEESRIDICNAESCERRTLYSGRQYGETRLNEVYALVLEQQRELGFLEREEDILRVCIIENCRRTGIWRECVECDPKLSMVQSNEECTRKTVEETCDSSAVVLFITNDLISTMLLEKSTRGAHAEDEANRRLTLRHQCELGPSFEDELLMQQFFMCVNEKCNLAIEECTFRAELEKYVIHSAFMLYKQFIQRFFFGEGFFILRDDLVKSESKFWTVMLNSFKISAQMDSSSPQKSTPSNNSFVAAPPEESFTISSFGSSCSFGSVAGSIASSVFGRRRKQSRSAVFSNSSSQSGTTIVLENDDAIGRVLPPLRCSVVHFALSHAVLKHLNTQEKYRRDCIIEERMSDFSSYVASVLLYRFEQQCYDLEVACERDVANLFIEKFDVLTDNDFNF